MSRTTSKHCAMYIAELITLVCMCTVALAAKAVPMRCPPGMIYNNCDTPDQTCATYGIRPNTTCMSGCFCEYGLIRDKEGKCIKPEECERLNNKCPEGQSWDECSLCERSCGTYYLDIMFRCPCRPGCRCNYGYIRNSKNDCITVQQCTEPETRCAEDQYFSHNDTFKTCKNLRGIRTSGCFCSHGLVFSEENRICVHPKECPHSQQNRECEFNDERSEFKICEPKYMNRCDGRVLIPNPNQCQEGCFCKTGYVLGRNGTCLFHCNDECAANETYSTCVNYCRNTCRQMFYNDMTCLDICLPACRCKDGYARNSEEKCVLETDCDPAEVICPPRQKFVSNFNGSISICGRNATKLICPKGKTLGCNWGCFCEDYFEYDRRTGLCVLPSECSNSPQNLKCQHSDPRSEFKMCTSSTRPTCTNRYPNFFTDDCRSQCRCRPGYYYHEQMKLCLTSTECDKYYNIG